MDASVMWPFLKSHLTTLRGDIVALKQELEVNVRDIRRNMVELEQRVDSLEQVRGSQDEELEEHSCEILTLRDKTADLNYQLEELRNRSRRCNGINPAFLLLERQQRSSVDGARSRWQWCSCFYLVPDWRGLCGGPLRVAKGQARPCSQPAVPGTCSYACASWLPAESGEGELLPAVCWGRPGLRRTFVGTVRRSLQTAALRPCAIAVVGLTDLWLCRCGAFPHLAPAACAALISPRALAAGGPAGPSRISSGPAAPKLCDGWGPSWSTGCPDMALPRN
ncbi:hypothetical protein NDU88_005701 [Pleurodeles waltl]|uniref:Uncharacterized protein n=1 Tax=Pleurodeles waltl TaxID=8319 RepID=A0AAV7PGC4_PLEWA|nr:hypothetical protein NDU88_005701 [Pleurodeles waltl]